MAKNRRTVSANLIAEDKARKGVATTTEFKPDYGYVKKDLIRIGILASSFFAILIILSFFLR
jgi:hypothetical protein